MTKLRVRIRPEQPGDEPAIHELTSQAFASSEYGYHGEAELVEKLRANGAAAISLVAEADSTNHLIGHILFSPAVIEWKDHQSKGFGLAPMSVLPEFQRMGIGSQLITAGFEVATARDGDFVIVLGHPEYYPKFGFTPASQYRVSCQFEDIPDEAFLIRWLGQPDSNDEPGVAWYHPVFSTPN